LSLFSTLRQLSEGLAAHLRAPAHRRVARRETREDQQKWMGAMAARARAVAFEGPVSETEEHCGQIAHRLRQSELHLHSADVFDHRAPGAPPFACDPARRPIAIDCEESEPRARAIVVGLERLRHDARTALLLSQALCTATDLDAGDLAWILDMIDARVVLVRSRARAISSLLPTPEWADDVCPIHGVRHRH
jgi:hypothetical protein